METNYVHHVHIWLIENVFLSLLKNIYSLNRIFRNIEQLIKNSYYRSSGGVLKQINDKISIIIIENEAHHVDLRASNTLDPETVVKARLEEIIIISKWLDQFKLNQISQSTKMCSNVWLLLSLMLVSFQNSCHSCRWRLTSFFK